MLSRLCSNLVPASARFGALSSVSRASSSEIPQIVDTPQEQSFVAGNIIKSLNVPGNRLFAVIFAHGRQFKVSQNDIIQLHLNSPLDVGQKIQLEKVLLVGGTDFTLFGRPTLDSQKVKVHATVVEKTATSPELNYFKLSGKKVQKMRWLSNEMTVLRINEIQVDPEALGV